MAAAAGGGILRSVTGSRRWFARLLIIQHRDCSSASSTEIPLLQRLLNSPLSKIKASLDSEFTSESAEFPSLALLSSLNSSSPDKANLPVENIQENEEIKLVENIQVNEEMKSLLVRSIKNQNKLSKDFEKLSRLLGKGSFHFAIPGLFKEAPSSSTNTIPPEPCSRKGKRKRCAEKNEATINPISGERESGLPTPKRSYGKNVGCINLVSPETERQSELENDISSEIGLRTRRGYYSRNLGSCSYAQNVGCDSKGKRAGVRKRGRPSKNRFQIPTPYQYFEIWHDNCIKRKKCGLLRIPSKSLDYLQYSDFNMLRNPYAYLSDADIDMLIDLMLFKATRAPQYFTQGWTCLQRHPLGYAPCERKIPWSGVDYVYGVAHIFTNHWVAYAIHLNEEKIIVYDSMYSEDSRMALVEAFSPLAEIIPWIGLYQLAIQKCTSFPFTKSKWGVEPFTNTPRQPNGYDCGIVAVKIIECLATGTSFDDVDWTLTPQMRKDYCLQLFNPSDVANPIEL